MKLIKVKLTFIIIYLVSNIPTSTASDSCLSIKDGYLIKVYKDVRNDSTLFPSDSYFFENIPVISKNTFPDSIDVLPGNVLLNMKYFSNKDFIRSIEGGNYTKYIELQKPIYVEYIQDDYIIEIYKVSLVFKIVSMTISEYLKDAETRLSHKTSRLSNSPFPSKIVDVILPEIILVW